MRKEHRLVASAVIIAGLVSCGTNGRVRPDKVSDRNPGKNATAGCSGGAGCDSKSEAWKLLAVNRVRILPRSGYTQAMVGGTIQGSNESATNGFVTLATVSEQPTEGKWTKLQFDNSGAYRWVKYTGPGSNTGSVAEVEFYRDSLKLSGEPFGTTGTNDHGFDNAFDGNTASYYEGTSAVSNYVGLDLGKGHVVATPRFSPAAGKYPSPQRVTISSTTNGVTIRYTTDGSNPVNGTVYTAPVAVTGTMTLRALATREGMVPSDQALSTYAVGTSGNALASLHVGNSLTDSIDGYLAPVAAAGGFILNYARYTVPGIGTWVYEENPTGGFGVSNVQEYNRNTWLTHLSFQPASNMPCIPTGYAEEAPARKRSDAVNIAAGWTDQVTRQNPKVRLWVYQTWLAYTYESNCFVGGWNRNPNTWNPTYSTNWDSSMNTLQLYIEKVRTGLAEMYPDRPTPYIIPAGQALVALKTAVTAGSIPGWDRDSFWTRVFNSGQGSDDHLTSEGQYFITLIFYGCMFQSDPRSLPDTSLGTPATLAAPQAAALQEVAWQTLSSYKWSGFSL